MEKPEQQAEEGAGGSRFADFALTRLDKEHLAERGFERLSAAQRSALPRLITGENVVVLAPSGTGRTALAAMMAVEKVDREQTGLQAVLLVLTPEAVVETAAEIARIGGWPETAVLAVQAGLRADRVGSALRKGAVVAVGTPARVLDLVQREALSLQAVAFLAVLEADLMLQPEAEAALGQLGALLPSSAQRMISAAQSTEGLMALARSFDIPQEGRAVSTPPQKWAQLKGHSLEVAEDEKLDMLSVLCARAHEEGRETVVVARSGVWRRWVEEGLAWRGALGCRVEEEGDGSAALVEQGGRRGGRRRPRSGSLVSYHLPLQPDSWPPAGDGSCTFLVTPAEYWDLTRLAREAGAAAVEAPAPVAEAAGVAEAEAAEAAASVPVPTETSATYVELEESAEAPAGPGLAGEEAREAEERETLAAVLDVSVPRREAEAPEGLLQDEVAAPAEAREPELPEPSEVAPSDGVVAEPQEEPQETAAAGEAEEEPDRAGSARGKRRREGPREDGLTEAERVARRHIKRDAARKIERIDPEDAVREAERLVRESVRESIYEQVFSDETPGADAAGEEREAEQEEAARRRRLEVAARLDEARRQLAVSGLRAEMEQEGAAGEEPVVTEPEPLTPAEEQLVAFAQRTLELVSGWLRAGQEVPHVHRALAERLLQEGDGGRVIAVLLQYLFPARPVVPAVAAAMDEEPSGVARLFISLGRQAGINQLQLLRLVEQMTGVPEADLGRADVLARYSFLEVKAQVAERVIAGMNGKRYRGREIAVDRAKPPRNA